jgi:putative Mg2+ transporter-C (MgtC) family protein
MDWTEVILRLTAATLAGGVLGLNRDLHGKPTGVRTLGLVGLGSALVVMAVPGDASSVSRVMQGIVTGIGFIGAGVIMHTAENQRVHGLTTAACAWLTACIGAACGVGQWPVVLVSIVLIFLVLIFGGRLEHAAHRYWGRHDGDDGRPPPRKE